VTIGYQDQGSRIQNPNKVFVKKIPVAVIGVGHLGSIHARIYSQIPDAELVGVSDVNARRCNKVARAFSCASYPDYRGLFGKIQAASVAVPTEHHYRIARELLDRGINILVEKPFTRKESEAVELERAAKEKNLVLQVGHVERYSNAFVKIKEMVKKPLFLECHRLGPFTKRSVDISVILDLMIHDIDIVLALVDSKPVHIDAVGVKVLTEWPDIANARIRFANGAVANITASRLSLEKMRKLRIFQEDTYISCDFITQVAKIYKKAHSKITSSTLVIKGKEPLRNELQSFIECVQRKETPIVSGEEAIDSLSLALQIEARIQNR